MKILAIDTSGIVASVCVMDETKTIAEFTVNYKKTHSQTIMPMVKNICDMVELDLSEVDYVAVSSGPGSFTGLRIGAATAKGLAHGLNKRIVPVPTLDTLAYNIYETQKIICPIMDARRGQVYAAFYNWNDGKLEKLTDYLAQPIEEIADIALGFENEVIFLGDGVAVHEQVLRNLLGDNLMIAPPNSNMQRASSLGALAFEFIKEHKDINYAEFAPFYIRKSQAEREYDEKHKGEEKL
jgi:tRNA threonylcarbamoyladenosine biosynthesis protein TsaB